MFNVYCSAILQADAANGQSVGYKNKCSVLQGGGAQRPAEGALSLLLMMSFCCNLRDYTFISVIKKMRIKILSYSIRNNRKQYVPLLQLVYIYY